ncbi:hypothetical protein [Geobacillus sp. YHL]|uniref:hypothetical protein n=1 Tax=Geobacillus sp. YHL TaxID=2796117 RepID=UPI001EF0FCAD|nr:hypothetical protein [Geobacillus sp. YHL]MCG6793835.1 hypothetical protein [Geobacillus sp. YHL]
MIVAPPEHHVFLVNEKEYVFVPYSECDVEGFIENEMAARIADNEKFRDYVNALTMYGDFLERFFYVGDMFMWNKKTGEWNPEFRKHFDFELETWIYADKIFKMNVENYFAGYPEYSKAYIEYVLRCDEEDVPFDDGFYQFVAKRMIEDGEIRIEWEKVM